MLDISTGGVYERDYTMVLGFPGRTNRYMSSFAVAEKQQVINPVVIRARHERMEIIKKHMEADPKVRLLYSDKYFNLSNYADYTTWENICLRRYDVAGIREAEEAELQQWIAETPERQAEYGHILAALKKGYAARAEAVRRKNYFQEAWISPYDAVKYDFRTTVNGYPEKYDPEDFEFRVDDKMCSLIRAGDWGGWGEKGVLYTDFITNNDITGGNSGSPVLNGRGNLVGLAFDGNRESMSGDIYFHPEYARTVCVDIRFVLWIIDRYAGAAHLIDEMHLVK